MRDRRHSCSRGEHGVSTVWLLIFGTVFMATTALVVDLLRQQIVLRQAQNAADASAVAAARVFDGTVQNWGEAKKVAIAALRHQNVMGVAETRLQEISFDDGIIDPFEETVNPNSPYRGTQASSGNLQITVERGAFWEDGFHSLEGMPLVDVSHRVSYSGRDDFSRVPMQYQVPVHIMANAVKVTVRVSSVPTFFAQILGISNLGTLERSSVSLSDAGIEQPVFPLAVPACALLLDTQADPRGEPVYDTQKFEPTLQCGREVVFTEANPRGPVGSGGYFAQRGDGMLRAEYFSRRATERTLPMYGVLGIPQSVETNRPADPSELRSAFATLRSESLKARLGQYFKPLHNAVGPGGLYGDAFAEELHYLISDTGQTVADTFLPGGQPAPNFPALRSSSRHDQRVQFGPNALMYMHLFNQIADPYVNPMCSSGTFDSAPQRHPAREVVAMVIAPTQPGVNFCDYGAVFAGQEQNTEPPIARANSRVVGFVKVNLFDYRVTQFTPQDARALSQSLPNPDRLYPHSDPGFFENQRHFVEESREWAECRRTQCPRRLCPNPNLPVCDSCHVDSCSGKPTPPPLPPADNWAELRRCFNLPEYRDLEECLNPPDPGHLGPGGFVEGGGAYDNWEQRCQDLFAGRLPGFGGVAGGIDTWGTHKPEVLSRGEACFPEFDPTRESCHLRPPQGPGDSNCWNPPRPMSAQYGCGGIRARLRCEPARLTSPTTLADQRAMIVQ